MVDQINPAAAAGLYANTQKVDANKGVGGENVSFGDILKRAGQGAIDTVRAGEKASAEAVVGTADLTDVVEAVSSAEMTLQTVVTVRDRMVSAYQEIMRMPI
jgi:flagellar hook-basal body complex protein FliE